MRARASASSCFRNALTPMMRDPLATQPSIAKLNTYDLRWGTGRGHQEACDRGSTSLGRTASIRARLKVQQAEGSSLAERVRGASQPTPHCEAHLSSARIV
jgi:hypothetical protein